MKTEKPKTRKIFLNNMNTWFSNFIIESLRTDNKTVPTSNDFMGICSASDYKLPNNFLPKIIKIDSTYHYDHEVFSNDVFIFNLEDTKFEHIEYIIKGLKTLKHQTEKTLILISSIMTWARTSPKVKKEPVEEDPNKEDEDKDGDEKEKEEVVPEPEQLSEDEEYVEEQDDDDAKDDVKDDAGQDGGDDIEKEPPVNITINYRKSFAHLKIETLFSEYLPRKTTILKWSKHWLCQRLRQTTSLNHTLYVLV
jgi:hypothetical protein